MKLRSIILTIGTSMFLLLASTAVWGAKGGVPGKPPPGDEEPPPPTPIEGYYFWKLGHMDGPHDASMASAASIYGCTFESARTASELRVALESAHARVGCTVVEAVVPPHGSAQQNDALRSAVEQAFRREGL